MNTHDWLSGLPTVMLIACASLCSCGGSSSPGSDASPSISDSGVGDSNEGADARANTARSGSINFALNQINDHDYGRQLLLPVEFGTGEFTLELWIKLDQSYPIGDVAGGEDQLTNWSDIDRNPNDGGDWWYKGNFLLDGHNNSSFEDGTFSLQLYGGGRLRWLFGDGWGLWPVQAYPASTTPSLLDGSWHYIALVRSYSGLTNATLLLYVDGVEVASTALLEGVDMRQWWNSWQSFPDQEPGWYWGAEKQAANDGGLAQYEDYKGLLDELSFWSRAKSAQEIAQIASNGSILNSNGLVGHFDFSEGGGNQACDRLAPSMCMDLIRMKPGFWVTEGAPLTWP